VVGDVSNTGFAGYTPRGELPGPIRAGFSQEQQALLAGDGWSSTLRETLNAEVCLVTVCQALGAQAAGHFLRYIGDNRGSIAALDRQTGCAAVFTVVKRLLLYCHARGVDLEFEWRPRTDAQVAYADSLSRFTDWSAVFFTKATYQFVCKVMGKHPNLDLFAGSGAKEHHTAQYFTVSHCPGTSGVDAFAQDWRLTPQGLPAFVWAFPPVWQIAACLRRFAQDRVSGLLVVPVGMKFWRPLLDRLPVKQRLSLPPHPGQYWLGSQAPAAWRGQPPLLFEVYKVEFI